MAKHFLDRFNRDNARSTQFSPAAMRVLSSCYWPGNVRELENCVERTATMAHSDVITDLAFPCQGNRCLTQVLHHIDREDAVRPSRLAEIPIQERPMGPTVGDASLPAPDAVTPEPVAGGAPAAIADGKPEGESERLVWAMERSGWVQAKAARLLKISPRQMGYALQKHGIEVRKF
jgi:Nif-specific regulatory protein